MHGHCFFAANMPEELGGGGLGHLDFALLERELGRGSMALGVFFGRPSGILLGCNDEQRERYLLPAIRGEKFDALAMTEPDAGSDVRGMKCTAKLDNGDWLVNGSKHFISHANIADFVIVFIATGEEETPRGVKKLIIVFWWIEGHRDLRSDPAITPSATEATRIVFSALTTAGCRPPRSSVNHIRALNLPMKGFTVPDLR